MLGAGIAAGEGVADADGACGGGDVTHEVGVGAVQVLVASTWWKGAGQDHTRNPAWEAAHTSRSAGGIRAHTYTPCRAAKMIMCCTTVRAESQQQTRPWLQATSWVRLQAAQALPVASLYTLHQAHVDAGGVGDLVDQHIQLAGGAHVRAAGCIAQADTAAVKHSRVCCVQEPVGRSNRQPVSRDGVGMLQLGPPKQL